MEVSVTGQAHAFLGALALGAALGLLYDLCRLVRRRFPWRGAGEILDLLYWPAAVAALFAASVALEDGTVRIYLFLGAGAGATVYFLLVSPAVVWLLNRLADAAALLLQLCAAPLKVLLRLACRAGRALRGWLRYRIKYLRRGRGPAGKS